MRSFLLAAFVFASLPAFAHVTLVAGKAVPAAIYDARFRVGHGCSGSPTTGLAITIPALIAGVEPLAAAGWTIASEKDGTGRIATIRYEGGSLPADQPGLFTLRLQLPKTAGPLSFAVRQICAEGAEDWTGAPGSTHPAPVLIIGSQGKADGAMGGTEMNSMPGMPH